MVDFHHDERLGAIEQELFSLSRAALPLVSEPMSARIVQRALAAPVSAAGDVKSGTQWRPSFLPKFSRLAAGLGLAGASIFAFAGLAVAGALPEHLQHATAVAASKAGIDLPDTKGATHRSSKAGVNGGGSRATGEAASGRTATTATVPTTATSPGVKTHSSRSDSAPRGSKSQGDEHRSDQGAEHSQSSKHRVTTRPATTPSTTHRNTPTHPVKPETPAVEHTTPAPSHVEPSEGSHGNSGKGGHE
jgi:hypothetical protein